MIKEGVFISIRTPLLVTNMAFSLLASLLTQNTSYQLEIKVTKVCYFGMPRQHLKILQFNLLSSFSLMAMMPRIKVPAATKKSSSSVTAVQIHTRNIKKSITQLPTTYISNWHNKPQMWIMIVKEQVFSQESRCSNYKKQMKTCSETSIETNLDWKEEVHTTKRFKWKKVIQIYFSKYLL